MGVYDHVKYLAIPYTGRDNFAAHMSASMVAGVASASTSTPNDVVKTKLMNDAGNGATSGALV